ncbi:MAG: ATP synthase F1 subunit gamma [Bacillota bacterium]|nr:ATP synthase F1 subunit gamma [Bacillota bacterium]
MGGARDIKRRIKSVKSTQQITKAMKLVSAAKLRKAQAAVLAVRPFARKIEDIIVDLGSAGIDHPYLQERDEIKRSCYVVIGSDRGQCGGFNANLNRYIEAHLRQAEGGEHVLVTVGRKVRDYCAKRGFTIDYDYTAIDDNPNFFQAQELAARLLRDFDSGAYDEIYMVYSEFKSAMVQVPMMRRLLPVPEPQPDDNENIFTNGEYIFEPGRDEILSAILPQYVDISVFAALQEAKASEHGARMTAMSSATDNASEMIASLTLSLNRARQAAITTEITEIVGGSAALQ